MVWTIMAKDEDKITTLAIQRTAHQYILPSSKRLKLQG
jgi:hypothetical protein